MEENRKTELMHLAGRLERLRRLMGQDTPQEASQPVPAMEEGGKAGEHAYGSHSVSGSGVSKGSVCGGAAHGNAADADRRRSSGTQPEYPAAICAQKADAFRHSPLPVPR